MDSYLEIDDIKRMEDAANCVRDKLLIRLLFFLGCRVTEVLSLLVEDIDFIKGTVTILHLKSRSTMFCPECNTRLSKAHSFCPNCGNRVSRAQIQEKEHKKHRTLPLDPVTSAMLEEYIKRGGPIMKNGKRYILAINRHRAWQIVRDCADRSGLRPLTNPETGRTRGISPHRLRDAFAVHAMKLDDSGDGLRLLQEHLGHASFDTTAKYRKIAGQEHRQWYNSLWRKEPDGASC